MAEKRRLTTATFDLATIAEFAPAIITIVDMETGEYVYANRAMYDILGYKPAVITEQGVDFMLSTVHPDDAERLKAEITRAVNEANKTGKQAKDKDWIMDFEYRVRNAKGKWVWLQTFGRVYARNDKGKVTHFINTSTDITERKIAEEDARHRSEELKLQAESDRTRLELALKASHMGTWEWDIATDNLNWSDQLKKLYGLKPTDTITYEKYQSLVHPEDRTHLQATIRSSLETGKSYKIEHRTKWPDGSIHWLLGQGKAFVRDGKAVRMAGTTMNIDARKEAEWRLAESEKRFKSLADAAPVMIWMSDGEHLRSYFNKAWLRFRGAKTEQEKNGGWYAGIHPDDVKGFRGARWAAVSGRSIFIYEYRLKDAKGRYRRVLDRAAPRFGPDNEFLGYVGTCLDIQDIRDEMDRRRMLEARTAALTAERAELIDINRAKDEFISLASHQLRTPATIVKQYVGMVLHGYAGEINETQMNMLASAYESNERQLKIINDLLLVARVDAGKVTLTKQPLDLGALVQDIVVEQTGEFHGRHQKVKVSLPKKPLNISLDRNHFHMALENIINNASKYSYEGKTIWITVKKVSSNAVVSVRDKGVGISKADQSKLFQKFSRIDNPLSGIVGGNGLGLYWANRIIELHGGTITVESKVKEGTIFTISIPFKT
jgi:PAS domain S-box-containing protein